MKVLIESEISTKLKKMTGWEFHSNSITKKFELKDFKSALAFVNKIGGEAEKMDHHPDIFMHSWNKVKITISTHSAGGVTLNDFNLAKKIEEIK
ncbi:MAG: 4a-hydroxytetrahydrobiopterin dehydratase [Ignavibacteriaceae bacterium]|nr:4a-hydroxytetrahydrobiopterin dehydratase [Ignavibacteriaceae bacterium]